jgi:hypothetical protein
MVFGNKRKLSFPYLTINKDLSMSLISFMIPVSVNSCYSCEEGRVYIALESLEHWTRETMTLLDWYILHCSKANIHIQSHTPLRYNRVSLAPHISSCHVSGQEKESCRPTRHRIDAWGVICRSSTGPPASSPYLDPMRRPRRFRP